MTVSLKHSKTSPKVDGTDTDLVQPSDWNAEHTLTLAAGKVLGRASGAGDGAAQELPLAVGTDGTTVISTNSTTDALRITQTGSGNALVVEDSTNPDSTPFVVSADGAVVVGGTARFTTATTASSVFQTNGSETIGRFVNDANSNRLEFVKSRSTTFGDPSIIVSNGDVLGDVNFQGADGSAFIRAASINAAVDGTPGTNDMPGRLVFSTTADGASSPTERMRIDSNGAVGIGTSSPGQRLHVVASDGVTNTRLAGASYAVRVQSIASVGASIEATSNTEATYQPLLVGGSQVQFTTSGTERARIDSAGNVGIGTSSPTTKLDVSGSMSQNVVAVAASAIDCSAGNYFTKTATGALTWTVTNVPSSRAYSFILELTNGGTGTQTWFSGIKWPGGTAPTLTTSGVDVLGFITDDGGTTWRGVQLMKDSK